MAQQRNALHAYLSDESHAAWQKFAEENGVSVTGLLEGVGLDLATKIEKAEANDGDAADIDQDWVKQARKIDAQRRRRGR